MDIPKVFNDAGTGAEWDHIIVRPCYVGYMVFRHVPLARLHNEWDRAKDNYDSIDTEVRVQAWQDLMALAKCFRERFEWDTKGRCPKVHKIKAPELPDPFSLPQLQGKPMWVTNGLKPRTPEWMEHWQRYPKEQPSMAKHSVREAKKRFNMKEALDDILKEL